MTVEGVRKWLFFQYICHTEKRPDESHVITDRYTFCDRFVWKREAGTAP